MEYGLFVDGEFVAARKTREIKSPYDGRVIGTSGRATPEEIERALAAATRAAPVMAALPAWRRAEILLAARDEIAGRREEFAAVLMAEAGKPIRFAEGEVARCLDTLAASADTARSRGGEILPLDAFSPGEGRIGLLKRVPAGPVSGIAPFNFPLNLVAHKVGPAVACGCPIVVKPASQTPLSSMLLADAFRAAGLPAGALAVVPCAPAEAAPLLEDPRMKVLTFTGSAEVGWDLKARAARKHVALELGGNAAAVVEPDVDIEAAAHRLALGAYAYAGQSCISVQRVLVHESVYDRHREAFLAAVAKDVVAGDPARPETIAGPMITAGDADRIQDWVRKAESAGARVLAGGGREGSVLEPIVLENVDRAADISCREAFGPVALLQPYRTFDEALDLVNDTAFGLQAGVFTGDLAKVMKAWNTIEAGGIIHNDYPTFRVDHMPYGGVKESGTGREGPPYAVEHLTELRLLVLNPGEPGD